MIKRLLFALVIVLIPHCIHAACSWVGNTGTVDVSGTYSTSDITDCLTDASGKTGDVIVNIPDSTLSNNSTLITVNMKTGYSNVTSLTIQGESACSLDYTSQVSGGVPVDCGTVIDKLALRVVSDSAKKFRLSNIELTGTNASYPVISMWGDTSYDDGGGFRIDHIFFNQSAGKYYGIIQINHNDHDWGLMDGVIDHIYAYQVARLLHTQPTSGDIVTNKDWIESLGLGTARAIYLEDSKMYCTDGGHQGVEHQGGGRTVIRHNHITNYWFGAHDASSLSNSRGLRKYELYENTIVYDATYTIWSVFATPRGGSGVVFNNSIDNSAQTTNKANYIARFYIQRLGSYASNPSPWNVAVGTDTKVCANAPAHSSSTCTVETDCGGTNGVTNYCVNIDGAADGDPLPVGYPARDQLGADQNADGSQTGGTVPFLVWGNTLNGSASAAIYNGSTDYIYSNRDYCSTTSTTMPASCNGIATTYSPFTYPHPLTGESEDTTAPTVTAANVSTAGTSVIYTFSEPITATVGAAFTLDYVTAVTLTCPAVSPASTSMTCTTSRTIYQSEGNSTFDYTGTKVTDIATNALGSISNQSITNLSTQIETPPALTLTITSHTGAIVTSFPTGISCGLSCSFDFDPGTSVTISGDCLVNYSGFTVGGTGCGTTTTMSEARNCTATCTKIAPDYTLGSGATVTIGSGAAATIQ